MSQSTASHRGETQPYIVGLPLFTHDCPHCTFLGNFDKHDLYFCEQVSTPTVIARYSSYGPDYTSGLHGVDVDNCLAEAKRRAIARGLLPGLKVVPRVRQLDVRDDHAVALLTAVADSLLAHRRTGTEPSLALLEMQVALNAMVAA